MRGFKARAGAECAPLKPNPGTGSAGLVTIALTRRAPVLRAQAAQPQAWCILAAIRCIRLRMSFCMSR